MQTLALLSILLPTAPAPAESHGPRTFVVLVGISEYADREIPPRKHAELDAQAIHDEIVNYRARGVEKEQITLLLGKSATREAILQSLDRVRQQAAAEDVVIVGFFCQGATLGERGDRICYLAADSTLKCRHRDAIHAADIAEIFDRLRSKQVCVLLDVSFSGFRTRERVALPAPGLEAFREFVGPDTGVLRRVRPGRVVLTVDSLSGSPVQEKHGLFAETILKSFRAGERKRVIRTSDIVIPEIRRRPDWEDPLLQIPPPDSIPLTLLVPEGYKPPAPAALPPEEAERFAKAVLRACDSIREEHYFEPSQSRLLDLGIRGYYERLREPIPENVRLRLARLRDMKKNEQEQLLFDIRLAIGQRPELKKDVDLGCILREMTSRLDRFSDAWPRDIFCELAPTILGIGATVRKSAATGLLEVVTPLAGSPADRAGLLQGDEILVITRTTDREGTKLDVAEASPTSELSLDECTDKLRGKAGTTVRLTVQRQGEKRTRKVDVVRERLDVETVYGRRRKQDGTWDYWLDAQNKIGYLRLSMWWPDTPKDLQVVLQRLQKGGVKGLVLDLRFNPGGLLSSAREVAGLFVKEGLACTMQGREGITEKLKIEQGTLRYDGPMIVLLNEQSASVTEMLAACLKDHQRCGIAGARSYGKASLQCRLRGLCEIRVTDCLFLRKDGTTWQGWQAGEGGILPDEGLAVPLSRREREELWERLRNSEILPNPDRPPLDPYAGFKDVQLERALAHLRGKIK